MDVGISKFRLWEEINNKVEENKKFSQINLIKNIETRSILLNAHNQNRIASNSSDPYSEEYNDVENLENENLEFEKKSTDNSNFHSEQDVNLSKINGFSRSMLKVILTDGVKIISALEKTRVPDFHIELPIGTKVLIKKIEFMKPVNLLIIDPSWVILGGNPPAYSELSLYNRLCVSLGKEIVKENSELFNHYRKKQNTSQMIKSHKPKKSYQNFENEFIDLSDIDFDI
ncbi:hypothetical protein AYI68_g5520 [Smittium mucronatum]|uniref:RecQ mediated genome instability protein 1 OB-fold domain-containing protein n=1 Tax=Smittium mucronatum TaxID=133383 RepID=A0A1R0GU14_9FUNG|nr:hypothetical protein AYI68_g5520 [Smittium mucronatum]